MVTVEPNGFNLLIDGVNRNGINKSVLSLLDRYSSKDLLFSSSNILQVRLESARDSSQTPMLLSGSTLQPNVFYTVLYLSFW